MNIIEITDLNRYYIITDVNNEIVQFNLLGENQTLTTGQPNVFSYLTEEEMISKLNELTGSDEYYLNSDYYKEK